MGRLRELTPQEGETLLPLISAWGTAIEAGEDAAPALATLRDHWRADPHALRGALDFAKFYQQKIAPKVGFDDGLKPDEPAHSAQRLARIELLARLLENEALEP